MVPLIESPRAAPVVGKGASPCGVVMLYYEANWSWTIGSLFDRWSSCVIPLEYCSRSVYAWTIYRLTLSKKQSRNQISNNWTTDAFIISNYFAYTKIKYNIYNLQYYSFLYNNDVRPVICEGWHFTLMKKSLLWPHHFTVLMFGPLKLV